MHGLGGRTRASQGIWPGEARHTGRCRHRCPLDTDRHFAVLSFVTTDILGIVSLGVLSMITPSPSRGFFWRTPRCPASLRLCIGAGRGLSWPAGPAVAQAVPVPTRQMAWESAGSAPAWPPPRSSIPAPHGGGQGQRGWGVVRRGPAGQGSVRPQASSSSTDVASRGRWRVAGGCGVGMAWVDLSLGLLCFQGGPRVRKMGERLWRPLTELHATPIAVAMDDHRTQLAGPPRGQDEGHGQHVAWRDLVRDMA